MIPPQSIRDEHTTAQTSLNNYWAANKDTLTLEELEELLEWLCDYIDASNEVKDEIQEEIDKRKQQG